MNSQVESTVFQAVLFDLGVVMLHLDYARALQRLLPRCDPAKAHRGETFLGLLDRTHLIDQYERGLLSAREFFGHFADETGFRGDFAEFVDIWRGIFELNSPMVELGRRVAARYPVYFLTNASDLHVPWVFERFPQLAFHQGVACSCYLGATKPDTAFYTKALQMHALRAEDCLFIDDRPENIAGAEKLHIPSLLYRDADSAVPQISSLLHLT